MTYAERVKKLRDVMIVSQTELAKILDVSVVTVNRWENKKFEPTIRFKRKLTELFIKYNIEDDNKAKNL